MTKKAEKMIHWDNLYGSSAGLAITSIINKSPLLIITPDPLTSLQLERELRFFLNKEKMQVPIITFPGWETLPFDHFSPHEDVISSRLLALYQLTSTQSLVVIVSSTTIMYRLPPKSYVTSNSFVLGMGEKVDFALLREKLESHGYNFVAKVIEHGEFAVRGSILDVFPAGSKHPYRIDLLDTIVDSIRIFDVDTQRSVEKVDNIQVLPAHEFSFGEEAMEIFYNKWSHYFGSNPLKCSVYQSINFKESYPGIEYYLPLFFEHTSTLFDYLPDNSIVITVGNIEKNMDGFWCEIGVRYEQLRHDQMRPILAPEEVFIKPENICEVKSSFQQILINNESHEKVDKNVILPCFKTKKIDIEIDGDVKNRICNIGKILKIFPNTRVLFVVESLGRREVVARMLNDATIFPIIIGSWQEFLESQSKVAMVVADIERPLHVAFDDTGLEVLIITEAQIFGEQVIQERKVIDKVPAKIEAIIQNLTELQINEPVVHIDHGVGRYIGLQKLQTGGSEEEFFAVEYANHTKLYVPVTSLGLISRYTGVDAEHVSLNHLGTKQWEKTKLSAMKQIRDTAAELLDIYARRQKARGFAFRNSDADYDRFISKFPFVITQDQMRAINEVIGDMTSERLMDRLICGDVGFGKTEVAMRAAFLAIYNNKQVAILTPTTLLAQQHFINFQDRFADTPTRIAMFSRFRSAKETKNIIEDLAAGKIDIVIGTHKLLQKSIVFKDLGLLIVDEEHRFGVRQKEHIKKLATNVDILTLTATPIPRTLNMAFAGIRDFSIISTPPAKRLAIKTFIREYDPYLIKEAILRETLRGGQVYFLHNDIATIERAAQKLKHLIPSIRVAIAHGQMRKQELERIMNDFYHLRINVLVCSTIIESGLDVPAANTIIISRADTFGLAQLHQLRGRVGRSHHQAYAYLITPPIAALSSVAKKRLEAVEAMKDLGTGFALATNDLEIRGAGELLGEKQSGVIQGIGFTLYMEILQRAVKHLKKLAAFTVEESLQPKTELELQIHALIPDKYVDNVNLRLVLYKRIADAKTQEELDDLQVEMIDRFGLLPEQAKNLFMISELKLKAQKLGIVKITLGVNRGVMEMAKDCQLDVKILMSVMQKYCKTYKFVGANIVEFSYDLVDRTKLDFVALILERQLVTCPR